MLLSILVYGGIAIGVLALVALLRPRWWLGFRTRRRALLGLVGATALALTGLLWPAREHRITTPQARLDEFVPAYQFSEHHEIEIQAAPEAIWAALRQATSGEIKYLRTLTAIRRFGQSGPPSVLNPPAAQPFLDTALGSGFRMLVDEPPREMVLGTLVVIPASGVPPNFDRAAYAALTLPGFAKAAMNFHLLPVRPGVTRLTTETRVFATDAATRRTFTVYWRLIYPGSAIIRRSWLDAVRMRAEGSS